MIRTILFDLDGTLLPMDQEVFTRSYFHHLVKKLAPLGYTPDELVKSVWEGTAAMVKNNGDRTNEETFWQSFTVSFGQRAARDRAVFDEFYREDFQDVAKDCGFNPQVSAVIRALKEKDFRLVLATNPIFPAVAQESRVKWAGLSVSDFSYITSYENSHFCKPNLKYYEEITRKLALSPSECLMVGNDVGEDMIAAAIGMKVFLLTDCLISKSDVAIWDYPHGGFDDFLDFIKMYVLK